MDCAIVNMSRFTSGLLKTAMETLYKHEQQALMAYINKIDSVAPVSYIQETQGQKVVRISEDNLTTGQRIDLTSSTPDSYGSASQHIVQGA